MPRKFQSSPGQKAGCNMIKAAYGATIACFNPHPARRPDATTDLVATHIAIGEFQSSPGQKAGCNLRAAVIYLVCKEFQSSPGQKAGCNRGIDGRAAAVVGVSILTRPEGRMQHPLMLIWC